MKKKIISLAICCIVAMSLISCNTHHGNIDAKKKTSDFDSNTNVKKEIGGMTCEIPSKWTPEKESNGKVYYYPVNGEMMMAYYEVPNTVEDKDFRDEFFTGVEENGAIKITKYYEEPASSSGTIYCGKITTKKDGKEQSGDIGIANVQNGIIAIMVVADDSCDKDYSDDFLEIISSLSPLADNANTGSQTNEPAPDPNDSHNSENLDSNVASAMIDDIEVMTYAQAAIKEHYQKPKFKAGTKDYDFVWTGDRCKVEGMVSVNGKSDFQNFVVILEFPNGSTDPYNLLHVQVGEEVLFKSE